MSPETLLKEYQEKYGRRITNKEECIDRIVEINRLGDDISDEHNSELILLNNIKDSYKMSTNINEQNEVMNVLRDITSNYNTSLEIITKELQLSEIKKKYTDTKDDYKYSIQQLKEFPSLIKSHKLRFYSLTSLWSFYTVVITTNFDSVLKNDYIDLSVLLDPRVKLAAWWILTILLCNIMLVNSWQKSVISNWTLALQKQRNRARIFKGFCSSDLFTIKSEERYFTIDDLCDFISSTLKTKPPLTPFFFMNIMLYTLALIYIISMRFSFDSYFYLMILIIPIYIFMVTYIFWRRFSYKRFNKNQFSVFKEYENFLKNSEQVQVAIENTAMLIIADFTNSQMIKQENRGLEVIYTVID